MRRDLSKYGRMMVLIASASGLGAAHAIPSQEQAGKAMTSQSEQPITLTINEHGGLIEAQVVSASPCGCGGRFRIESQSGASNHTANTSSFSNIGEAGKVLSKIRFGGSDNWNIKLIVSIDGRSDYVINKSSS